MDDNFQFGEPGEVKKVSILIKYQNIETMQYQCCSGLWGPLTSEQCYR